MKSLHNILTCLVAAVFIYSAIGQSIVLHYCNAKSIVCTSDENCCSDESTKSCCDNEPVSQPHSFHQNIPCCTIASQYLVNPFSVRQPEQKEVIEVPKKQVALFAENKINDLYTFIETDFSKLHSSAPPGRIILLFKSILVI
jgi:hypothetical protein